MALFVVFCVLCIIRSAFLLPMAPHLFMTLHEAVHINCSYP